MLLLEIGKAESLLIDNLIMIGDQQASVKEPRLCLLVETPGQTVMRQTLIDKIWNNYAGADEALTQTISVLRKVLMDDQKELLQTVPKKGYVFKGSIADTDTGKTATERSSNFRTILVTLAVLAVAALAGFLAFQQDDKNITLSGPVAYPSNLDSISRSQETPLNTVETKGPDGSHYKLIVIGDRPPIFYINGERIGVDKWEKHMPLINFLKQEIKKRKQATARSSSR